MTNRVISSLWRRVKPVIARISPSAAQIIPSWRMYRRSKARFGAFQEKVKPLLYGKEGPVVLSGPFQGLPYLDEIGFCGPILPKWIGSYECELHEFVESVIADPPALIVDIGSAEGCYAVLLAARLPGARVVSFDFDLLAVRAQRRLAALNRVGNLEIEKMCDHARLASLISSTKGMSLVICDIEGAELEVIDPAGCSALAKADILVELHEVAGRSRAALVEELGSRFASTHSATFIPLEPRDAERFAAVCPRLSREDLERALDEDRGVSCGWLVLKHLR